MLEGHIIAQNDKFVIYQKALKLGPRSIPWGLHHFNSFGLPSLFHQELILGPWLEREESDLTKKRG